MRHVSLRMRLVLSFALVAVIPLAVTLLVTSSITAGQFRKTSIAEIESIKGIVQSAFQRAGQNLTGKADGAMRRYDLIEILYRLYDPRRNPAEAQSDLIELTRRMRDESGLQLFELVDGRGVILASAQEPGLFQVEDLSLLRLIRIGKQAKGPFLAVRRGITVKGLAFLVVRRFDMEEDVYLVAGDLIDQPFLESLPHTADTAIVLTSASEGRVLAQDNEVGRAVLNVLTAQNAAQTLPASEGIEEVALGSVKYFAGAVPLPGSVAGAPVSMHVLSSQENLRAVRRRLAVLFVLHTLLGGAVAWGLGYWSAGRITSPVRDLVQGLERVARGDLDTEIATRRKDEIGVVIASFNRMIRDLKDLREDLLRAERIAAWQEIARRLAHEIKNPLSPIQLCIETLRKSYHKNLPEFDEIMEESTLTILEEVEKLKAIVKEFSDFARLPKPSKTREDMHDILRRSLALFAGAREKYAFAVDLAADDATVMVDADQLHRVFINIIKNAMEAMPDGGEIAVRTERPAGGRVLAVRISDRGPGVPPERRNDIFKPYYTEKQGGSGLGLSIVHRIVGEHGGQIRVGDRPGGGAEFSIELPVAEI